LAPSEAAEKTFVAFLGGRHASVSDLSTRTALMMADYAHAGRLYLFDDAGRLAGPRPWNGADDLVYWQRMQTKYGSIGWLGLAADISEVAKKHSLLEYIRLHEQALEQ
jgi:hypothetical protein